MMSSQNGKGKSVHKPHFTPYHLSSVYPQLLLVGEMKRKQKIN
jgi:hypothetical protein